MEGKDFRPMAGTSNRYGVRGLLRAGVIASSLLALLNGVNACKQQSAPTPSAEVKPMNMFGMGRLPICGVEVPRPTKIVDTFRLTIEKGALDELISSNGSKHATYFSQGNEAGEQTDNSMTNYVDAGQTYNVYDNPYSTDLTTKGLSNAVVQYDVILKGGNKVAFMTGGPPNPSDQNDSKRKTNGILADQSLIGTKFICVEDPIKLNTPKQDDQTTTFYVQNGNTNSLSVAGFNVVLVPTAHGTDTPIMIDPKILNNG